MLTANSLRIGYDDSTIIWDVDLMVEKGQIVAVLGRNGVGKTTLLRGITRRVPPTSGNVYFHGNNVIDLEPFELAARGMAYVPQSRDIFSSISVEDNIRLGSAGRSKFLLDDVMNHVYDYFPALQEISDRNGGALSGGQKQQLSIARALNSDPDLLLLDEPSEGVQPSIVSDIGTQLENLSKDRDMGVLIVEQNLDLALHIADYCYVLENGRIVESGTPAELESADAIEEYIIV
jgi:urea ABC transporter ATP-binding protein UrtE